MGARISIDFLSHTFRGQHAPVLQNIDLDIAPGEQVALIGRSGCGKSTLLHMISGLQMASDGCVRINGSQVTKPSAKWNMMFQKPSLFPWMSVRQNAELGLAFAGKRDIALIERLLAMIGLADKSDARVDDLSGGQQQRVALARSLATSPDVLLLDEPFSSLDAFTRASLQEDVARIARENGITLVLVTHDIDEAVAMADRVLIMVADPGRIASSIKMDMSFPRDRVGGDFIRTRERLMRIFSQLSGSAVSNAAGLATSGGSSPQASA